MTSPYSLLYNEQDIQRITLFYDLTLNKANDSYFQIDDDNKMKCKHSHNHSLKGNCISWKYTAPFVVWNIVVRMNLILDIHSIEYTLQSF